MRRVMILALLFAPLCIGAQEEPRQFSAENVKEMTATVESVNHDARTVVLRGPNDARMLVVAGEDIRSFDQIRPGDRVVAAYREAILVEMSENGEPREPAAAIATKQPAGVQRPAVGTSAAVTTTVVIESVDRSFDTVSFKRPDGIVRTVALEDPKATQFAHSLQPGDEVRVTYTEASAISFKPAAR